MNEKVCLFYCDFANSCYLLSLCEKLPFVKIISKILRFIHFSAILFNDFTWLIVYYADRNSKGLKHHGGKVCNTNLLHILFTWLSLVCTLWLR